MIQTYKFAFRKKQEKISFQFSLLTFKKMQVFDLILSETPPLYNYLQFIQTKLNQMINPNDQQKDICLEKFIIEFDKIILQDLKISGVKPHQF